MSPFRAAPVLLALVASSVACVATPGAPGESTGAAAEPLITMAHVDLEARAECDSLMQEIFLYDWGLQSAIAGGCKDPGRLDELSLGVLNLAELAYPVCVDGWGIGAWFGDYSRHVLNASKWQTDCMEEDAVYKRCPVVDTEVTHTSDVLFCHKWMHYKTHTRVCTDPADVAYCQQYFHSQHYRFEKSVCSKQFDIEVSLCTSAADPIFSGSSAAPAPPATSDGVGDSAGGGGGGTGGGVVSKTHRLQ